MQTPPRPADEASRLAALRSYEILDTLPEDAFDDLADLAAKLCDVPMALITFVDEDRQWNKACIGAERDAVDRELSFCGHVVAGGQPIVVEDTHEDERFRDNPLVTGDPGYRFYAGVPITDPQGHALGTVCVLDREPREITDERVAGLETIADQVMQHLEERVEGLAFARESEFFQAVLDSMEEHVAILDAEGEIVATNERWDAFARKNGAEAGPGTDYMGPLRDTQDEHARQALEGIEALLAGDRATYELEYPCHGPKEERWFRLTGTAFEHRGHRRVAAAHRDVTAAKLLDRERDRLVADLEQRDAVLESLARALPQVLWLVGADLEEMVFVSPHASELWGLPEGELEENPLAWLDVVHEDDAEEVEAWLAANVERMAQDPDVIPEIQTRIRHEPSDQVRWIRVQGVPIYEDGELSQVAGISEDVTEQRKRQREEQRRAREAARAIELQQVVFATSHSLRTQIRQIASFTQLLERSYGDQIDDDAREILDYIVAGVEELEALHQALRRYGEVTQATGTVEPVELDALVGNVVGDLEEELAAVHATVEHRDLPTVQGDPQQLKELFRELLANAVSFRGEEPLHVAIEADSAGEDHRLRVQDNGRGFAPDQGERLFDVFEQLDPDPGDNSVGIGLTICKRIVENHGGEIRGDGKPGEGATIAFTLPAADGSEDEPS